MITSCTVNSETSTMASSNAKHISREESEALAAQMRQEPEIPQPNKTLEEVLRDNVKVKIVLLGQSQAGKSHLIKNILSYPGGDPSAPPYGQTNKQRTDSLRCYYRQEALPGIELYDAMGIGYGQMKISAENYWRKQNFDDYDAYILVTKGVITEDERLLRQRILKSKKPFLVVVTNIDQGIKSDAEQCKEKPRKNKNKEMNDEEKKREKARYRSEMKAFNKKLEQAWRKNIFSEFSDLDSQIVYFVNNRKPFEYDYQKLLEDLPRKLDFTDEEKAKILKNRLFTLSEDSVRDKAKWWRQRRAAIAAVGLSGASPIPFADIPVFISTVLAVLNGLQRDFYLTRSKLIELFDVYGLDKKRIGEVEAKFEHTVDSITEAMKDVKIWSALLTRVVGYGAIILAANSVDDVLKCVPGIGTIIGCALGAATGVTTTYYVVNKAIDNLESDGLTLVRELRRMLEEEK